jgi:hypothetical protein
MARRDEHQAKIYYYVIEFNVQWWLKLLSRADKAIMCIVSISDKYQRTSGRSLVAIEKKLL